MESKALPRIAWTAFSFRRAFAELNGIQICRLHVRLQTCFAVLEYNIPMMRQIQSDILESNFVQIAMAVPEMNYVFFNGMSFWT